MESMLLTVRETADELRIHEFTVRRRIWAGEIPCVKIGKKIRVSRKWLREWIEAEEAAGRGVKPAAARNDSAEALGSSGAGAEREVSTNGAHSV